MEYNVIDVGLPSGEKISLGFYKYAHEGSIRAVFGCYPPMRHKEMHVVPIKAISGAEVDSYRQRAAEFLAGDMRRIGCKPSDALPMPPRN